MNKTFIFDLDDTLIRNTHYYSHAKLNLARFVLNRIGLRAPDCQSLINLQTSIDKEAVKEKGFSSDRFPNSCKKTYKKICETLGIEDSEGVDIAYQIGCSVFNGDNWKKEGLLDGAEETLDFLVAQNDKLVLLTKGDVKIQRRKFEVLNLNKWFRDWHIVERNKDEVLKTYLDCQPQLWHVGNSIRSDIEPSLKLGIKTIYLPCETWAYEMDHNGVPEDSLLIQFDKILKIKEKYSILK